MGETVVSQVIVGALVSQAATVVAERIGLSPSAAGLVGVMAGVYAGTEMVGTEPPADVVAAPGDVAAPQVAAPEVAPAGAPVDAMSNIGVGQTANNNPGDLATGGDNSGLGNNPLTPNPANRAPEGMLSQPNPAVTPTVTPTAAPTGDTADSLIKAGTTPGPNQTKQSWWDKLMNSEKTADMLVAGIGGIASAGMAKEDREYAQRVNEGNAALWSASNTSGGMLSLSRNTPSQGGG